MTLDSIEKFPFMLSRVEAFIGFFSRITFEDDSTAQLQVRIEERTSVPSRSVLDFTLGTGGKERLKFEQAAFFPVPS